MLWYVLPLAIGVALSVFPVLAAVLLLRVSDPVRASVGYASGWSLGIVVLVTAFAAFARLMPRNTSGPTPSWVHYAEIVVGAFLIVQGMVKAVRELRRTEEKAPPQWLQRASSLSPQRAFIFGLVMNVRPKNLALTFAAGLAIGAAPISLVGGGIAVVLFAVVGASTVAGLVLAYVLSPQGVRPLLRVLDGWLASNAAIVLRFSIVLIGVVLVALGVSALRS